MAAASPSRDAASEVEIPRYIPLPDCLYKLRRRFPTVTQCILLECLRCRQWVPVEVLDAVPNEVPTTRVRLLKKPHADDNNEDEEEEEEEEEEEGTREIVSFYPSAIKEEEVVRAADAEGREERTTSCCLHHRMETVLTFAQDPRVRVQRFLTDTEQARARMFREAKRLYFETLASSSEWSAGGSVGGGGGGAAAGMEWHSPRLREHRRNNHLHGRHGLQNGAHDGNRKAGVADRHDLVLATTAEQQFGASVLQRDVGSPGEDALARRKAVRAAATERPLYIPNPAVFLCPWQSCNQADLLLDVRVESLSEIYTAVVKAKVVAPLPTRDEAKSSKASTTARRVMAQEDGGGGSGGDGEVSDAFQAACDMSAHLWSERHALNELLAKEVDLRKSGRLAKRRGGGGGGGFTATAATGRVESNASLLHSRDPSSSDEIAEPTREQLTPVHSPTTTTNAVGAQRLQARFLKAAAQQVLSPTTTTAAFECRGESRESNSRWDLHPPPPLLTDEDAVTRSDRRILSAFCWVTCDSCGKLRRLVQPFSGACGAPFVCALAAGIGSCEVPEGEGVVTATAHALARDEELAIMHLASSQLPEPLASRAEAVLHGGGDGGGSRAASSLSADPLLRLVHSDAARRAFGYGAETLPATADTPAAASHPPSASSSHSSARQTASPLLAESIAPDSFPVLKQLAALVKRRSIGIFVRQLCLTPQEIRKKREEVLRAYLCDDKNEKKDGDGGVKPGHDGDSGGSGNNVEGAKHVTGRRAATAAAAGKNTAHETEDKDGGEASSSRSKSAKSSKAASATPAAITRHGGRGRSSLQEKDEGAKASPLKRSAGKRASPRAGESHSKGSPDREGDEEGSGGGDSSSEEGSNKKEEEGGDRGKAAKGKRHAQPKTSSASASPSRKRSRQEGVAEEKTTKKQTAAAKKPSAATRGPTATTTTTTTTTAAAVVVRRRRGRPPGTRKVATAKGNEDGTANLGSDSDKDQKEKIFWVQCDRCDKWRILPQKLPSSVKFWECRMRPNTTCADRDDEEAMDAA